MLKLVARLSLIDVIADVWFHITLFHATEPAPVLKLFVIDAPFKLRANLFLSVAEKLGNS